MLLAWLGLEVLNMVLNIITVVLVLATAASGVNPELADEMVEAGIDAEDVPTAIWAIAIVASCIYIAATGKDSVVKEVQTMCFTSTGHIGWRGVAWRIFQVVASIHTWYKILFNNK